MATRTDEVGVKALNAAPGGHGADADASRARVLASALVVETAVGLTFFFPLYSETLKRAYDLSNGSVQLLASMQNVGGSLGIHIGMLYDRLGPRSTILFGLFFGGLGWGGLWLTLAYGLPVPFALLVALAFLQGHGQLFLNCASVPTVALHFPSEQYAVALGLVKSLIGLSGSLAAQVYTALYAPPEATEADLSTIDSAIVSFLRLITLWFSAACVVGTLGLRREGASADPGHCAPPQGYAERARLDGWLGGAYGRMLLLVAILACGALVNEHIRAALIATGVLRALHTEQLTFGLATLALAAFIGHVFRGPVPIPTGDVRDADAGSDSEDSNDRRQRWRPPGPADRRLSRTTSTLATALLGVRRGGSFTFGSSAAQRRRAFGVTSAMGDSEEDAREWRHLTNILASEIAIIPPVPTNYERIRPVLSTADLFDGAASPADETPAVTPAERATREQAEADASLSSWQATSGAPNLSLGEALVSQSFWLQFGVEFALSGSGLMLTNNLAQVRGWFVCGCIGGTAQRTDHTHSSPPRPAPPHPAQIVRALGPSSTVEASGERPAGMSAASLVSLLGVCNCTGRLAVALVAESLARRGMPRSLPFVLACLLMATAHLLVASHSRALLAPACALCGFAFGALAALNPVVLSTLYGSKAFGAIYTTIMVGSALGSLALSSGLAVAVYARATAADDLVCVGEGCFRPTALSCAALCAAASLLAAKLSHREAQNMRRRTQCTRESVEALRRGRPP